MSVGTCYLNLELLNCRRTKECENSFLSFCRFWSAYARNPETPFRHGIISFRASVSGGACESESLYWKKRIPGSTRLDRCFDASSSDDDSITMLTGLVCRGRWAYASATASRILRHGQYRCQETNVHG
ncbi:hypothetical protein R1flu_019665 [Riccia fluitans]|uniref:Uncharacterized protein n=1 Tax=Riccia fluitans TaxID=41844 RepID=A0ABD1ZJP2_9MARC